MALEDALREMKDWDRDYLLTVLDMERILRAYAQPACSGESGQTTPKPKRVLRLAYTDTADGQVEVRIVGGDLWAEGVPDTIKRLLGGSHVLRVSPSDARRISEAVEAWRNDPGGTP